MQAASGDDLVSGRVCSGIDGDNAVAFDQDVDAVATGWQDNDRVTDEGFHGLK